MHRGIQPPYPFAYQCRAVKISAGPTSVAVQYSLLGNSSLPVARPGHPFGSANARRSTHPYALSWRRRWSVCAGAASDADAPDARTVATAATTAARDIIVDHCRGRRGRCPWVGLCGVSMLVSSAGCCCCCCCCCYLLGLAAAADDDESVGRRSRSRSSCWAGWLPLRPAAPRVPVRVFGGIDRMCSVSIELGIDRGPNRSKSGGRIVVAGPIITSTAEGLAFVACCLLVGGRLERDRVSRERAARRGTMMGRMGRN